MLCRCSSMLLIVLCACAHPDRFSDPRLEGTAHPRGLSGSHVVDDLEIYLRRHEQAPAFHVLAAKKSGTDEGGDSSAAEMARKLQNPLANIKALMTDNAIGFDTGIDGGTSFGFQIQPVYAIDLPDRGFTIIPRAVIPIMGLEPGTDAPPGWPSR